MYYDMKESGLRIQELRKGMGITQDQLAERINSSLSTIGKIERGINGVSIDLLIEFAMLFDTSLDYIILGKRNDSSILKEKLNQAATMLNEILSNM